jgi:3-deoxy-D-manno-octulosonic-acid transferase
LNTLYNIFTVVIAGALQLASPFLQGKTRQWVVGRRHWREKYMAQFQPTGEVLWMHVSSLGEFEQGRPVIEAFRKKHPNWQLVVTFFSPSGYEMRKNYPLADFVAYLPIDSPANARDFLNLIRPSLVIFIKYDFWPNYLSETQKRNIPFYLIAALFRPDQPFFKWYGGLWLKMLHCYTHIFTQTAGSKQLLTSIGYLHATVCGDPRVDRVLAIAAAAKDNNIVAQFSQNAFTLIIGSSWEKDEALIFEALQHPELQAVKVICAPHQPSQAHIAQLCERWGNKAIRYSQVAQETLLEPYQCLIIDNIGMLNTLYRYGTIAYIGGGFGAGIHNTLEPAAFGLPVLFGPKYQKFEEAKQLIAAGGAFCVQDARTCQDMLLLLLQQSNRERAVAAVNTYMESSKGATIKILSRIG